MRPIQSTVITDPEICREVIREALRKPTPEVIERNEADAKLLEEMTR